MDAADFLIDGPAEAPLTVVLAHGAGAPMDSPFMEAVAARLGRCGWRVARFEFPYMAKRRVDGKKRPPDGREKLMAAWRTAIAPFERGRLVVGGKSMGGRMASLLAAEEEAEGRPLAGCLCFGYPFHPPGKPDKLRTGHLQVLTTPILIVQGERDPFGTREDVTDYDLSDAVEVAWLADGNHDLSPRKASGRSAEENLAEAVRIADGFLKHLTS